MVSSLLELFMDGTADAAWHGGCLALAELARRGLLLPSRLSQLSPLICRALCFDVRRGPHRSCPFPRSNQTFGSCGWQEHRFNPSHLVLFTCLQDQINACRQRCQRAHDQSCSRRWHAVEPWIESAWPCCLVLPCSISLHRLEAGAKRESDVACSLSTVLGVH